MIPTADPLYECVRLLQGEDLATISFGPENRVLHLFEECLGDLRPAVPSATAICNPMHGSWPKFPAGERITAALPWPSFNSQKPFFRQRNGASSPISTSSCCVADTTIPLQPLDVVQFAKVISPKGWSLLTPLKCRILPASSNLSRVALYVRTRTRNGNRRSETTNWSGGIVAKCF